MSVASGQEGGCQCGAIRYRLLRAPVALYACHCRDCQKQSSSAFGLSMWVERDAIEFTGAEPRIYRTRGGSGREKLCAFCGECGTRLYHSGGGVRAEGSTTLSMKAGTLDDTSVVIPTCHLWDEARPAVAGPDPGTRLLLRRRAGRRGSPAHAVAGSGSCPSRAENAEEVASPAMRPAFPARQ